jgi:hypothetical protein
MPHITEPDDTFVITDRLYPPSVVVATAWHRYGQHRSAWQRPADRPASPSFPVVAGSTTT